MVYLDRQYKMVKIEQKRGPNPKLPSIESIAREDIPFITVIDHLLSLITIEITNANEHRHLEIHDLASQASKT